MKLNLTNPGAVSWFLDRLGSLQTHLGMEYVTLEGGEGNLFEEQALRPPPALAGDKYIELLADLAARMGDSTVMTAATRYPSFFSCGVHAVPPSLKTPVLVPSGPATSRCL